MVIFPRIFREQKRVAKVIIGSQEEAYWRLVRPPVSNCVCVCVCVGREREEREREGDRKGGRIGKGEGRRRGGRRKLEGAKMA